MSVKQKLIYETPQTEEVLLEARTIICQSDLVYGDPDAAGQEDEHFWDFLEDLPGRIF